MLILLGPLLLHSAFDFRAQLIVAVLLVDILLLYVVKSLGKPRLVDHDALYDLFVDVLEVDFVVLVDWDLHDIQNLKSVFLRQIEAFLLVYQVRLSKLILV